jgi:hypothetical protein
LRELDSLKIEGPSEAEVAKRAEISRRDYETSVKYNSWWLDRITSSFTVRCYKGDLSESFGHLESMRQQKKKQKKKHLFDSLSPAASLKTF